MKLIIVQRFRNFSSQLFRGPPYLGALRVTCAVLHDFGLLTADLRRHVRPFARLRMAAIYLLLANSALMIEWMDSDESGGSPPGVCESLLLRVKPNGPSLRSRVQDG